MTTRNISFIFATLLGLACLWYWTQYGTARLLDTDYSTLPPQPMLSTVLGVSSPSGVKSIVIAGHHGYGNGSIWMKVTGSVAALSKLTSLASPIGTNAFKYSIPSGNLGVQQVYAMDAHRAGWDEVPTLSHPDAFLFHNTTSAQHWIGYIVVDRPHHTAYISAQTDTN